MEATELLGAEPTPVPPQRPSSGRTVQVRRSRPASAIRPATAATLRPSNLKAGAVPGLETVSFSSHTQSGAATRSPRYHTATTRPAAPSQPTTVRRDATGLLVRAVLTRYATAVLASACVSSRLRRRAARSSPRAVRARHGAFVLPYCAPHGYRCRTACSAPPKSLRRRLRGYTPHRIRLPRRPSRLRGAGPGKTASRRRPSGLLRAPPASAGRPLAAPRRRWSSRRREGSTG